MVVATRAHAADRCATEGYHSLRRRPRHGIRPNRRMESGSRLGHANRKTWWRQRAILPDMGGLAVVIISLVVAGILGVGGVVAILVVWRRGAVPADSATKVAAARRAMSDISHDARRARRGSIRGQGMGGSDALASDAAYGADTGIGSG